MAQPHGVQTQFSTKRTGLVNISRQYGKPLPDPNRSVVRLETTITSDKYPDARCLLENGSFTLPLEAGDNKVAVAIANNNFFGWGLKLGMADPEGFYLAAK